MSAPELREASHRGRVLIASEDREAALKLSALLTDFDFLPLPIARSAEEMLSEAHAGAPEAVLMDMRLADGADGIDGAALLRRELGMRVVYLSADLELALLERAKQTLPYGFLLKPVRPLELRSSVELAIYYRRQERAAAVSERPVRAGLRELLSEREIQVLTLIAQGHTSKDVASALRIAKPTVDTYRARLSEKLGLKNRSELMSFAAREGLLGASKSKR